MKFTFKGFVKMNVSLIKVIDKDAIKFTITDTGVGISKEDQSNLFKLFFQLDKNRKINRQGTGIGLYYSKKFAKTLGFSHLQGIQVESEEKKGSTFWFIIENKEIDIENKEIGIENKEMDIVSKKLDKKSRLS